MSDLPDAALLHLLSTGTLSPHKLEADVGDAARAVALRRAYTAAELAAAPAAARTAADPARALAGLPLTSFDAPAFYKSILNTNCEAVIGYVPYPVGVVGPLKLDGLEYRVPLATTEGALVASTNRGCAAIRAAGGATTVLTADGMTRAPLVRLGSLKEAAALRAWLDVPANFATVAAAFDSTTRFGRLLSVTATVAGRSVYLRFKAFTGDAMGMNMVTKGVSEALAAMKAAHPSMTVLALSGNLCTDKKPSAVNWVTGRGKSVAAEVRIPGTVLQSVLKTSAGALASLNVGKNLVGSALAGSVGGFNAHASNLVTALFLATGQDPAQNVESSNCLTLIEVDEAVRDAAADPDGKAGPGVVMSVTLPCVEVATVGGGTSLPAQAACLELLGLRGASPTRPGANAEGLARVVAGVVLAGELSLMAALTTNDLLNSHLKLNRKPSAAAASHDGHGHHGHHHGGHGAHRGALVTPAILARLAEMPYAATAGAVGHAGGHSAHAGHAHAHAGAPPPPPHRAASAVHHAAAPAAHAHHAAAGPAAFLASAPVPGGAPLGAHASPLHVAHAGAHAPGALGGPGGGLGGGAHGAAGASPGRRFFASPTAHRAHRLGAPSALPRGADGGALTAAVRAAGLGFVPADAGEGAGAHHHEPPHDEPMMCVP